MRKNRLSPRHIRKLFMVAGLALAQLILANAVFAPEAHSESVPSHLTLMASSLYKALEKSIGSVPDETKHGKILKDSQRILEKAYVYKWSVQEFSTAPVKVQEELEKPLDLSNLTQEEMQTFLAPDFYMRKIEAIKAIYDRHDKKLPEEDKIFGVAQNIEKALSARWAGMETSHILEPEDNSRISLNWDPQRHNFKMLVEKKGHGNQEGFETLLRGDVDSVYDPETGTSKISVEPSEDPIQPLTQVELQSRNKLFEDRIWGKWLSDSGETWVFSSVDEQAHGAIKEEEAAKEKGALSSLSAKKAQLDKLKKQKVYIWKNIKTDETISQKKFKKLKDENFEYQGQDYAPETAQIIKSLEEEIVKLEGEANKKLPIDQHDPVDFATMLGQGPLSITVTDKDGYSFTYDEAYHEKGIIRAQRTLRDNRDITLLPQTIIQQLIASWSPPEWIEIRVDYDDAANRLAMNVDRFRMHVTYSGDSMEVGSIHTPYKTAFDLRRAEEFDPVDLRFLDQAGKEIIGELAYDQPVQVEVEFDEPQDVDQRMVRLSWSGDGQGLRWVQVQAVPGNKKIFRSKFMVFVPPEIDEGEETEDGKLKL